MICQGDPGRSAEDGLGLRIACIERLDPQAVIGFGDKLALEWRALEHAVHQLAPLLM